MFFGLLSLRYTDPSFHNTFGAFPVEFPVAFPERSLYYALSCACPLTACYYFVNWANIYLCEWWSIGAHQISSRGVPGGFAQHPTPKVDAACPVRTDAKTWDPDLKSLIIITFRVVVHGRCHFTTTRI